MNLATEYNFLKSALTTDNPLLSTDEFLVWLTEKKASVKHNITPIPFAEMKNWYFDQIQEI